MRIVVFCLIFLVISLTPVLALEYNLVYDGNGNLLSGDGFNRTYNGFNQLSTVSYENGTLLYNYTFHPIEERVLVKKEYNLDGSLKEKTVYVNEMFVVIENISGVYNFTYVKVNGQLLAENVNGETKFILNDHLGSSSVITDENGSIIENTTYTPFGSIVNGGSAVRYGYEGKEHDGITSDVDFHFRQYKPSWGIFLQPDSLLPNVYDPQQLNRYAFERNNPYKYTDPDGHSTISVFLPEAKMQKGDLFRKFLALSFLGAENRKQTLETSLREKYNAHVPATTCIGCSGNSEYAVSFEELQRKELNNELDLVLDDDGEIVGYTYGDHSFSSRSSAAHGLGGYFGNFGGQGFYERIVKEVIDEKTSSYEDSRTSNRANKFWGTLSKVEEGDPRTSGEIIRDARKKADQ